MLRSKHLERKFVVKESILFAIELHNNFSADLIEFSVAFYRTTKEPLGEAFIRARNISNDADHFFKPIDVSKSRD